MKTLSLNNSIFLVNPISGKLSLKKKIKIINNVIRGTKAKVVITSSEKDAKEKAAKYMQEKNIVVACGGDGLMNIVAHQAILNNCIMGVFPFGRGNDFASSLNIFSFNEIIKSFKSPNIVKVKYIDVNFKNYRRISLTCAGVGLLSEAASRASKIPFLKGIFLYATAAIFSFINLKNHNFNVKFDNQTFSKELLILAAAVSQFTGGGMFIAPDALKIKNKFNLLYASKVGRLNAIKLLLGVLTGNHLKHYAVKNLYAKKLEISTNENNALASLVYGDGEYLGQLPVKIQLGNKELKVIVPKKS